MSRLTEYADDQARDIARQISKEPYDAITVGAATTKSIVFRGKTYLLNIDIFWEKSRFLTYKLFSNEAKLVYTSGVINL